MEDSVLEVGLAVSAARIEVARTLQATLLSRAAFQDINTRASHIAQDIAERLDVEAPRGGLRGGGRPRL